MHETFLTRYRVPFLPILPFYHDLFQWLSQLGDILGASALLCVQFFKYHVLVIGILWLSCVPTLTLQGCINMSKQLCLYGFDAKCTKLSSLRQQFTDKETFFHYWPKGYSHNDHSVYCIDSDNNVCALALKDLKPEQKHKYVVTCICNSKIYSEVNTRYTLMLSSMLHPVLAKMSFWRSLYLLQQESALDPRF